MSLLPLAVVTVGAATVQGVAGFGFGLIALPAFMWLLGSRDAVPLVIIVNLLISALLVVRMRGAVNRRLLAGFSAGGLAGLFPGLLVFRAASVDQLMTAVGVAVLVFVGVAAAREAPAGEGSERGFRSASAAGVGVLSGGMTIALGMPGPPIALYMATVGVAKDALRATALAFFVAAYSVSLLIQWGTGGVTSDVWRSGALLLPIAGLGGLLGNRLSRHVDERAFRLGVLLLLLLIGLSALVRGLIA